MTLRIRGWGRDLNRVQKERIVNVRDVSLSLISHISSSILPDMRMDLLTSALQRDDMFEKRERLIVQASLEDMEMLLAKITGALTETYDKHGVPNKGGLRR